MVASNNNLHILKFLTAKTFSSFKVFNLNKSIILTSHNNIKMNSWTHLLKQRTKQADLFVAAGCTIIEPIHSLYRR